MNQTMEIALLITSVFSAIQIITGIKVFILIIVLNSTLITQALSGSDSSSFNNDDAEEYPIVVMKCPITNDARNDQQNYGKLSQESSSRKYVRYQQKVDELAKKRSKLKNIINVHNSMQRNEIFDNNESEEQAVVPRVKHVIWRQPNNQEMTKNSTSTEFLDNDFNFRDYKKEVMFCSESFDGKICWPESKVGEIVQMPCPDSLSKNLTGLVPRRCGIDGSWSSDPIDYSVCLSDREKRLAQVLASEALSNHENTDIKERYDSSFYRYILNIRYECLYSNTNPPNVESDELYCPRTFDGWSCWNDTPAGETAYTNCPNFIVGFDITRKAHKLCREDGSWFRHPQTGKVWSNYTTCVDIEDLRMRRFINNIFVCGYSISMIALVFSLIIFYHFRFHEAHTVRCMYRSLRCTRIRIHKNLFMSFIINNILWIVWYREVVDKTEEVILPNQIGCQVLHIVVHYFMLASYFWMFCEGVYLHTLLVIAFVSEEKIMRWFYVVGWIVPAIIMTIYSAVRGNSEEDTLDCWMDESYYTWILSIPVCVSMLTNLVFLINIVRVLITKLWANNGSNDVSGTKKAVKATLILIPLLGLHYIIIPFRPDRGSAKELIYQIVSAIVTSLQGFFVALLFCFLNSEVVLALRKKWSHFVFLHERRKFSCSTAYAYSLNGNAATSEQQRRFVSNRLGNGQLVLVNNPAPETTGQEFENKEEEEREAKVLNGAAVVVLPMEDDLVPETMELQSRNNTSPSTKSIIYTTPSPPPNNSCCSERETAADFQNQNDKAVTNISNKSELDEENNASSGSS